MSFYRNMATVAHNLLSEFGQSVTITRKGDTEYNPYEGVTNSNDTVFNGVAIFEPYEDNRDDSLIEAGDIKITLASKNLSEVPQISDTIHVDGIAWRVVNIKELNPAGTSLIYEIQARK
ncbi:MAG: hypothetical protein KGV56_03360 [Gammaproteobacteria bacterium]|nr:hypothetical protein [Gammaproteobacteria bacterium]